MFKIKHILLVMSLLYGLPLMPTGNWASSSSSALEYLFSFGMMGLGIKNQLSLRHFEDLPDASKEATRFVHEQLKHQDVPNYEDITVKVGTNYGAINDSLIILMQNQEGSEKTELDDLLEESKHGETPEIRKSADSSLDVVKSIISHETQHLLRHDLKGLIRAQFIIPLITYAGTRLIEEGVKQVLPEWVTRKRLPSYIKNGYKIFKGAARYVINAALYLKLSRYQEQRADDSIPNNPKLLKAFKEFLYLENELQREHIRKRYGDHAAELFDTNRIYYEYKNFVMDGEHPSPLTRIKKINERLAKLEGSEEA